MNLKTPVGEIPHIGDAHRKRLKKLGISVLSDLLYYFPREYRDYSKIQKIRDIKNNEDVCIQGKVLGIEQDRAWAKKISITKAIIQDDSAAIQVVWFNQPYLINYLKKDEELILAGKTTIKNGRLQLVSPTLEKISLKDTTHLGRIAPIYSETKGITSRWLRHIIKPILLSIKDNFPETLPQEIIDKHGLLSLKESLYQIHFPDKLENAERAKERLSFEQLFLICLFNLKKRLELRKEKAPAIPINLDIVKRLIESLPFNLTDDQRKCTWQILKDMEQGIPMNRLLQGDVGSGKTVVSAIASINAVKAKNQVVLMAPTEILVKQHFKTIFNLLKDFNINIGLLTGKEDKYYSKKLKTDTIEISRKRLLEKTEKGEIDILIGTHALISPMNKRKTKNEDKVKFKSLGLIIVDEQHRFGVKQRASLSPKNKEKIPHLLSMTATPIPRTLALTIWGDLNLSIIEEMPKGRKKIITEIITEEKRLETYNFIEKEAKSGRQIFVICPRIEIEEDSTLELKTVKEEYEKLSKNVFPNLKIAMLHGKMTSKEKDKTMKDFRSKKFDILVSTSVVEVGIDIPNATVMMIEGSDRFGLSQLHQFRGRVGRAEHQSYCFLLTDSKSQKTDKRLKAMIKYDSGFKLSEVDLRLRGPGDFFGVRQWGLPDFAMSFLGDTKAIAKAKESAEEIIKSSPSLEKYPSLKARVESFEEKVHLE
ncbi:MAG: ATP-dependent DNA helicase RecG [Candidatus Pacebacteria bacterium]|nr:ATP-dependent DNA helicase RecG [Candidatus Paceibacterota bacterium]